MFDNKQDQVPLTIYINVTKNFNTLINISYRKLDRNALHYVSLKIEEVIQNSLSFSVS